MINMLIQLLGFRRVYSKYTPSSSTSLYGAWQYAFIPKLPRGNYYIVGKDYIKHGQTIMIAETFRNSIKEYRKSKNISQNEFASTMGMRRVTQYLLESDDDVLPIMEYIERLRCVYPDFDINEHLIT